MKYCAAAALVGMDEQLPSDPSVAYSGKPPVVGCNHLVCVNCGAVVRHADRCSTTTNDPPSVAALEELYDSDDPASSALLDNTPAHRDSRAYFCRCDWRAVNLGGELFLDDIDQPWECGGHSASVVLDARDIREAEARKATDALIAEANLPPAGGYKIRFTTGPRVNLAFSTAAELRDSLLGSYPDAEYYGGPFIGRGRDDTTHAWEWVVDFIKMRSDWHPALGIALQHAARDGGDLARRALVNLLIDYRETIVLLPWSTPIATEWPDVRAKGTGTGWGLPDFRLDQVVRDQATSLRELTTDKAFVYLSGYGKGGTPLRGPFTSEADLKKLLEETARSGQFPGGDQGPWSWLAFELLIGADWVRPALTKIISTLDTSKMPVLLALLDWFSEEPDLWRFAQVLEGWAARPPSWWDKPANTKPSGWKYDMRSAHWPGVKTLGDVVREAAKRAKLQALTPPVVDLPVLYGAAVS